MHPHLFFKKKLNAFILQIGGNKVRINERKGLQPSRKENTDDNGNEWLEAGQGHHRRIPSKLCDQKSLSLAAKCIFQSNVGMGIRGAQLMPSSSGRPAGPGDRTAGGRRPVVGGPPGLDRRRGISRAQRERVWVV